MSLEPVGDGTVENAAVGLHRVGRICEGGAHKTVGVLRAATHHRMLVKRFVACENRGFECHINVPDGLEGYIVGGEAHFGVHRILKHHMHKTAQEVLRAVFPGRILR